MAKALAFLLELVMDFLRVQVSPMVFFALISAWGLETELVMLSSVFVQPQAMEWAWPSSSDACESVLVMARKLFLSSCLTIPQPPSRHTRRIKARQVKNSGLLS